MLRSVDSGAIQPFFIPTYTPTRTFDSYATEGETHFIAGDLNQAIAAYQQALQIEPDNADLWAELARIQVYSSTLLITDQTKRARLEEASQSVDNAIAAEPENSTAWAVKAFALDWLAEPGLVGDEWQALLTQAEQAAVKAIQIDNQNTLALAYYAEVLVDQQKWLQADQNIEQAVQRDPSLMDVHRINGYVQESLGNYSEAVGEYLRAVEINPNLTFLYMSIGVNYRNLRQYDLALEYFAKAAVINEQLGVQDPIPYLSIANTYVQQGQFFSAGLNARKGLRLDPENPDVYARLGVIYHNARNYEGAIPALKCAIRGCTAQEACDVRECDPATEPMVAIEGLLLSINTKDYYLTYSSALAGMHRDSNGYCIEAMEITKMLKKDYYDDEILMSNVEENETICNNAGYY
jgi:tetratricopeptide (TPR) repeat protein